MHIISLHRMDACSNDDDTNNPCKERKDTFDRQLNTNETNNTIEMNAKSTDAESMEQRHEIGMCCSMKSNQNAHHLFTQNGCLLELR